MGCRVWGLELKAGGQRFGVDQSSGAQEAWQTLNPNPYTSATLGASGLLVLPSFAHSIFGLFVLGVWGSGFVSPES